MENNINKSSESLHKEQFDKHFEYGIENGLGGSEAFIYATIQVEREEDDRE